MATEAAKAILQYGFEQLHLPRLICVIDPEHIASQRVAEKIGMRLEVKMILDNLPTWIYSKSRPNVNQN